MGELIIQGPTHASGLLQSTSGRADEITNRPQSQRSTRGKVEYSPKQKSQSKSNNSIPILFVRSQSAYNIHSEESSRLTVNCNGIDSALNKERPSLASVSEFNMAFQMQGNFRARSANNRALGIPRGLALRSGSVDSGIVQMQKWRPVHYPDLCLFNSKQSVFKQSPKKDSSYKYFGSTRINIEDPIGLYFKITPRNKEGMLEKYSKLDSLRKSDSAIMTKSKQRSSSVTSSKGRVTSSMTSPIGQPYDYRSWCETGKQMTPNQIGCADCKLEKIIGNIRLTSHNCNVTSHNCNKVVDDNITNEESKLVIDSFGTENITKDKLPEIGGNGGANVAKDNVGDNTNILQNEGSSVDISSKVKGETKSPSLEKQTEDISNELFVLPSQKQTADDLSFSKYFVLKVGQSNTKRNRKRSVRFRISDDIRWYEPTAPVKS